MAKSELKHFVNGKPFLETDTATLWFSDEGDVHVCGSEDHEASVVQAFLAESGFVKVSDILARIKTLQDECLPLGPCTENEQPCQACLQLARLAGELAAQKVLPEPTPSRERLLYLLREARDCLGTSEEGIEEERELAKVIDAELGDLPVGRPARWFSGKTP